MSLMCRAHVQVCQPGVRNVAFPACCMPPLRVYALSVYALHACVCPACVCSACVYALPVYALLVSLYALPGGVCFH